jgi:hypothetical protein
VYKIDISLDAVIFEGGQFVALTSGTVTTVFRSNLRAKSRRTKPLTKSVTRRTQSFWPRSKKERSDLWTTLRFRSQYDLFFKNLNPVRRIRELTRELVVHGGSVTKSGKKPSACKRNQSGSMKRISGCARTWKPRNAPPSVKPRRSHAASPKATPTPQAVKLGRPMARTITGQSPIA